MGTEKQEYGAKKKTPQNKNKTLYLKKKKKDENKTVYL